jgi:16S rRNA (cytosine967-C5)-methyltransferase
MTNTRKKPTGRELAFTALWRVAATRAYADIVLDALFNERRPERADKALASELTYGVLRWQLLLDHRLAELVDRPLAKVERKVLLALRLGAYQLLLLDRVADAVAVNDTVSLAPAKARGFVNAVLRKLATTRHALPPLDAIADPIERLSIAESHPRWMAAEWSDRLGPEAAAALCRANNQRPGLTLRVNALRTGREALIRLLAKDGIAAEPGRFSPLAIVLAKSESPRNLPGYDDGLFAIQDEASQLVPFILAPRPGELILDACAAPGTKSLQLMQLMNTHGRVIALDLHPARLQRMAPEAQRLGLKNITRIAGDATMPITFTEENSDDANNEKDRRADPGADPGADRGAGAPTRAPLLPARFKDALFDRILVDAPCSGLGAIRHRPEIKWTRTPEDVAAMASLQSAILANVAHYLKPGGILVYSTCTFTLAENEAVIQSFLASSPFTQEDPAHDLPPPLRSSLSPLIHSLTLRTWPHLTGTDGFTVFRLRKLAP